MERKTLEYAREKFAERGLTLLTTEYKSVDTPMDCVDSDGYHYFRTLRTAEKVMARTQNNFQHRFSLKNKFFWENIQHYMETQVNTGTILLTKKEEYPGGDDLIVFQCGKCGGTFKKSWHGFIVLDNKICPRCFKEIYAQQSHIQKRRNDKDVYIERAKNKGYKIICGDFSSIQSKAVIEDGEGYRALITLSTLDRDVGFDKYSLKNPYTLYNIRLYLKLNKINVSVPNQVYKGNYSPITFQCKCGRLFYRTLNHCIENDYWICPACRGNDSRISSKVRMFLEDNNIEYRQEETFEDCVGDKALLRFDYYLPEYKSCIEVDGIQHYKPIPFKGDKENAKEAFKRTKKYDKIKTKYCLEHNIPLLRIPFWDIEKSDNYKLAIGQFLSLQM